MKLLSLLCASALAIPSACFAQTTIADTADLPSAPVPMVALASGDQQSQQTQQSPPQSQPQTQNQTQPNSQQQPPANNEPSLGDLGITPGQTQGSAKQQELLNKRTHMLKVHQTLGLITVAPLVATLITGPMVKAKGKNGEPITEPTTANLDTHIALGAATTALYWTSAAYAIFAPKLPDTKKRGAIRFHEALAWIHGPGMILTPALGIAAYKQENSGEKVHGIASAHGPVAYTTAIAYGAAIIAVSWPIHIHF